MAVHLWTTPHAVIAHRAHSPTTASNPLAKRSTFENGEKWGDYQRKIPYHQRQTASGRYPYAHDGYQAVLPISNQKICAPFF
jgi:hypothetical protein